MSSSMTTLVTFIDTISRRAPPKMLLVCNANTSICEITFAWLARYKHMVRKMDQWTSKFFVSECVDMRNVMRTRGHSGQRRELAETDSGLCDLQRFTFKPVVVLRIGQRFFHFTLFRLELVVFEKLGQLTCAPSGDIALPGQCSMSCLSWRPLQTRWLVPCATQYSPQPFTECAW